MRCKSCDRELNDRETRLKEADGVTFVDLCGNCYLHSQDAVERVTYETEVEVEEEAPPSLAKELEDFCTRQAYFLAYVREHDLLERWRDGAGVMDPMDRCVHMHNAAFERFTDNLSMGMQPTVAIENAVGKSF